MSSKRHFDFKHLESLRSLLHEDGHDDFPDVSHHTNTPSRLVDNWRPLQPLYGRSVRRSFELPGDMRAISSSSLPAQVASESQVARSNVPPTVHTPGDGFAVPSPSTSGDTNSQGVSTVSARGFNNTIASTSIAAENAANTRNMLNSMASSATNSHSSAIVESHNSLANNAQRPVFNQFQTTQRRVLSQSVPKLQQPSSQTNSSLSSPQDVSVHGLKSQVSRDRMVTSRLEYLTSGAGGTSRASPDLANSQNIRPGNILSVKTGSPRVISAGQPNTKKSQVWAKTNRQQPIYIQEQTQQRQSTMSQPQPQQQPRQQQRQHWGSLQTAQQLPNPITTPRPQPYNPKTPSNIVRSSQQALQEFLWNQEQEQRRKQWQLREFRVHNPQQTQQTLQQQQQALGKNYIGIQSSPNNKLSRNVLFSRPSVQVQQEQISQSRPGLYIQSLTNVRHQGQQKQNILQQQHRIQQEQLQQFQQQQLQQQRQQQLRKLKIQQQQQQQQQRQRQQQPTASNIAKTNLLRNILQTMAISNRADKPNILTSSSARINPMNSNGLQLTDLVAGSPVYSSKSSNTNGLTPDSRFESSQLGVRGSNSPSLTSNSGRSPFTSRQMGNILRTNVRPTAITSSSAQYELSLQQSSPKQPYYPTPQQQQQGQGQIRARHPHFGDIAPTTAVGALTPSFAETKLDTLRSRQQQSLKNKIGSSTGVSTFAGDDMPKVFLHRIHQPVRIRRPFYERLYNWRYPQY
ncbi:protein pf14_0175 [Plakobranchus ocellatus]|uniref:Protein pf14_0175 n=1 Tax=Plakobranchus ocellatus TaxID=259542 RepID=A0AAV4AR94_9GAST|nr:protein pf14_0175 [Plakobranchus ocellatus]